MGFIHTRMLTAYVILAAVAGCSVTPIGFATNIVGDTISDSDVKKKEEELLGAPIDRADVMLGQRQDTFTGAGRNWMLYPAGDVMNNQMYVVEAHQGKVIAVSKVQKNRDLILNSAQKLEYQKKAIGFTQEECQKNLELGRPRLTVRSEDSGDIVQLYDARIVKSINKPHYCILRFDGDGKCKSIDLATVQASTKQKPFG